MKTIERILADNVRTRRKTLKLSQEKLAENAKVSMHTILRLEKGRQRPQRANLDSIAKALGCTIEDLYREPELYRETASGKTEVVSYGDIKAAVKEAMSENIIPDLLAFLSEKSQSEQSDILDQMKKFFPSKTSRDGIDKLRKKKI